MPSPLYVQVIGPCKVQLNTEVFKFIYNGSVKDPLDPLLASIARDEEVASDLADVADVDRLQSDVAFQSTKVRQRLLLQRIDLHQKRCGGVGIGIDSLADEIEVRLLIGNAAHHRRDALKTILLHHAL